MYNDNDAFDNNSELDRMARKVNLQNKVNNAYDENYIMKIQMVLNFQKFQEKMILLSAVVIVKLISMRSKI